MNAPVYRLPALPPPAPPPVAPILGEPFAPAHGPCPKCTKRDLYNPVLRFRGCSGSWWRRCPHRLLHLHARCVHCGSRWIMRPADVRAPELVG